LCVELQKDTGNGLLEYCVLLSFGILDTRVKMGTCVFFERCLGGLVYLALLFEDVLFRTENFLFGESGKDVGILSLSAKTHTTHHTHTHVTYQFSILNFF
jgi:hypothetical protein